MKSEQESAKWSAQQQAGHASSGGANSAGLHNPVPRESVSQILNSMDGMARELSDRLDAISERIGGSIPSTGLGHRAECQGVPTMMELAQSVRARLAQALEHLGRLQASLE